MYGDHTLSADLSFNDEDWQIAGTDYEQEFREAAETVREDPDEKVLIDADSLYCIRVRWNDQTEEIRFDVLGMSETYILRNDAE